MDSSDFADGNPPTLHPASAPPATDSEKYFLVIQEGPGSSVRVSEFATRQELMSAIRTQHFESLAGKLSAFHRVLAFQGRRVRITGDPIRFAVFPDGERVPLIDQDPDAGDDGRLLPPSFRGVPTSQND